MQYATSEVVLLFCLRVAIEKMPCGAKAVLTCDRKKTKEVNVESWNVGIGDSVS